MQRIFLSSLSALLLIANSHSVSAEAPNFIVKLKIESKAELKKEQGRGFVVSTVDGYETTDLTVSKIGEKLYQVSFEVPANQIKNDAVATAMFTTDDGNTVFSDVTPSLTLDPNVSSALLEIKDCPPDSGNALASPASMGPLRQLVDIRSARSDLGKLKLGKILDEQFLTKLKRFETAFGLKHDSELSIDLPPDELVSRLSRLSYAIGEYKSSRAAKDTE